MSEPEEQTTQNTNPEEQSNPQVIYSWKAPLRPYIKRSGKVLRFYLTLTLLISLIIFFIGDRILLIPIWTLMFLFYVLTITPPPEVENNITKFGIETSGTTLRWESLAEFYFTERFGYQILTVISHAPYFYHAYLVIPTEDVKHRIIEELSKHLVYQPKPKKTVVDRMTDFLSNLVLDES